MQKFLTKALSVSLLSTALVSATLSAQAANVPADAKLAAEQVLKVNNLADPTTLDVSQVKDSASLAAVRPLYETLVRVSADNKLVPQGAVSWEVNPEGTVWTFKLRPEATWSDGKPVVAADYVYAWQRKFDPKTANENAANYENSGPLNAFAVLKGQKPVSELGVKALDEHTLQFTLVKQDFFFVNDLVSVSTAPLRQDLVEKYPTTWQDAGHQLSNGPFVLKNYKRGDFLEYEANPYYWDKQNLTLTGLKAGFVLDRNASVARYLTGDFHATAFPGSEKEKYLTERKDEVHTGKNAQVTFLGFNLERVPLKARQALQLLTDQKLLTEKVLKSGFASSIYVPSLALEAQKLTQAPFFTQDYKERQTQAVKLLQEAGYTSKEPLKVGLLAINGDTSRKVYVALADWFNKGTGGLVDLEFEGAEPGVFVQRWLGKDFDLRFSTLGASFPHARNFYDSFLCKSRANTLNYCNPEFDKLYAQAEHTGDAQVRAELYEKLNQLLFADVPVATLWHGEWQYLVSPAVGGYNGAVEWNQQPYTDFYILDESPKQ